MPVRNCPNDHGQVGFWARLADGRSALYRAEPLPNTRCPADIVPNVDPLGDGLVNEQDLVKVISGWGTCAGCLADINGSGLVDIDDLLLLISAWRACP